MGRPQTIEDVNPVNARLGARRLLTHAIFTPGQPGWMEALEVALVDLKPDLDQSRHPWRLDDEKLLSPAYEKLAKAGVVNVCIHRGLKLEYERRGMGRSNRRYGYVVRG